MAGAVVWEVGTPVKTMVTVSTRNDMGRIVIESGEGQPFSYRFGW